MTTHIPPATKAFYRTPDTTQSHVAVKDAHYQNWLDKTKFTDTKIPANEASDANTAFKGSLDDQKTNTRAYTDAIAAYEQELKTR